MNPTLCISFRFIQPYALFHGRGDAGEAEWPPSPMRAFQALLNAACLRTRGRPLAPELRSALQAIEVLRPTITAPRVTLSTTGHRIYVPHNQADLVTAAWSRGNYQASIASHRIDKDFRPYRIETVGDELPTVHYLYPLDAANADPKRLLIALRPTVRSITHLGWGIDQVVADVTLAEPPFAQASGESWNPAPRGGRRLRVHRKGSLDALTVRYDQFLNRLINGDWTPVPPLSEIDQVQYRRDSDPLPRPHAVFRLLDADDDTYRHAHGKLIHIAGMVRHLAIRAMASKRLLEELYPDHDQTQAPFRDGNPPRGCGDVWVERYVAGHRDADDKSIDRPHAQFSYVPLPSIGHHHTDPAIRRVMIIAPVGDDAILEHLCIHLDGQRLQPEREQDLGDPVFLHRAHTDKVASLYTQPSNRWASVTPVILPGYDDRKPAKTRKLIKAALAQSGIDQPCEFEWSAYSHFPQSFSAHKYDKSKRPIGYVRPNHLLHQTAVHLTLTFANDMGIPGPLTLGAGRHCGFGLMATVSPQRSDMVKGRPAD